MANKVLRTRIAQKFALADQWKDSNLVLLKGELAIDEQNRIKIGDGVSKWKELPFAVDPASTAAITFPDELPNAADAKAGSLVMTPDGILWALGGEEGNRKWVDLTNKADVEELQESIDALQADVNTKDEALQSAVVALKNSDDALEAAVVSLKSAFDANGGDVAAQIAAVQEDVDKNAADIATNLEAIRRNEESIAANASAIEANAGAISANATAIEENAAKIQENEEAIGENAQKIAENKALIDVIYDAATGQINASVLPSFVDDVIEGTVCATVNPNDPTYTVTHNTQNGGTVIGFFKMPKAGATEDTDKVTLVCAGTPESVDFADASFEHNGTTYTFKPVTAKEEPETSAIYVDVQTNQTYRWSGSQFVIVASDLAIGETSSSAFAGSRGVELETKATALETKTDELETKTDELENKLDAAVVALQNSDASHDAAIVSLQQALAGSTSDIDAALEAIRSDAAQAHQELSNAADTAHQAIEDEIDALRQDAEAQHSALDAKIGTAIATLQQSVTGHESAIVTLQQKIAETSSAVDTITLDDVLNNSTVDPNTGILNVNEIWFDCGDSKLPGEEDNG